MNMMIAMTISPGAVTAAERAIVFGKAWPIMPPPAATSTRKNVPKSSENSRRHSCFGFLKSSIGSMTSASNQSPIRRRVASSLVLISTPHQPSSSVAS